MTNVSLIKRVDPKHTALMVIDMQNDYCHEEGYLAKQGLDVSMVPKMIQPLKETIEEAEKNSVPVIYVRTVHQDSTDSETWTRRLKDKNQSGLCRKGTWGASFFHLEPKKKDVVVTKHRYSAFIHTRLESVLRTYGVETIVLAGVSTNICVESTARDGFMLDYDVVMLSDCTGAFSQKEHDMAVENVDKYFGSVSASEDVINAWKQKVAVST
ncbi:cysteine hydrolase [Radiobacillus kanasensis]|uniref:cysteine hydrolase family protein n=1 Tax=Radiobacillus kanasensis TaxID=2844358 RepID=UPI001E59A960|nr:isochorismatase family cysteine hydrolase [Radiobacillus kanasensis]UFT99173.1 cysteine hydrolase [Radiobacillus kanasensis]